MATPALKHNRSNNGVSMGRKVKIWKGGRHRKPKFERDYGTAQTQLARVIAIGGKPIPVYANDGTTVVRVVDGRPGTKETDAEMGESPLGVYFARGGFHPAHNAVDPREAEYAQAQAESLYEIGMYLRFLYGVTFGRSSARGMGDTLPLPTGEDWFPRPSELDEHAKALCEWTYRRMAERLRAQGSEVFKAVWDVCVMDKYVGPWHQRQLCEGLQLLKRERTKILRWAHAKVNEIEQNIAAKKFVDRRRR